jgi:putative ABC transport system substrate-binding protein
MTHGADPVEPLQRAAAQTDRILRGAAVADVPFELPTRYGLTLNLPAGRALGPAVPASIVGRADRISA